MHGRIPFSLALLLAGVLGSANAQDVIWRAAKPASSSAVTLGQPTRLSTDAASDPIQVVRGQIGEPPPPPAFPGGGPVVGPVPDARILYDRGMVNNDSDLGGFWTRTGDKFRRCWDDVSGSVPGAFQSGANRAPFQSECDFQYMNSPVTQPFYFEDPRALTELRPFFIWQNTPSANPIFAGGNNFHYGLRGSVAFTPYISLVVNRLGFTTLNPNGGFPPFDQSASGFSELMLGPKITFIRSESTGTVAAIGLTFDIPTGPAKVMQDTGNLSLIPYFSIAQNFGKSQYGSFNFMNTTGYAFGTDSERSDSFFASFHLDYNVGCLNRFWPMIEVNWRHYMHNGTARPFNFEGNDLANFGSNAVSGRDELTLAIGGRIKLNNYIHWGLATEFNVLQNGDGRHLDRFRLTTDLIFRY